ncbi:MAG: hypothetical protein NVSMB6_13860 [Burkholderiaceae bacterium]
MYWKLFNKTTAVLLLNVATGLAFAQFAWIDANGVRQYSDQPPPASTPKSRILKAPGSDLRSIKREPAPIAAADPAPGAASAASATPKPTLADKNADFNKRRAEQGEKERKADQLAKESAIKTQNCDRAKAYARTLASGERIMSTDSNGERAFMSDEKRAQEAANARRITEACT